MSRKSQGIFRLGLQKGDRRSSALRMGETVGRVDLDGPAISTAVFEASLKEFLSGTTAGAKETLVLEKIARGVYMRTDLSRTRQICEQNGLEALRDRLMDPGLEPKARFYAISIVYSVAFFPQFKMNIVETPRLLEVLAQQWWADSLHLAERVAAMWAMMCFNVEPAEALAGVAPRLAVAALLTCPNDHMVNKCLLLLLRMSFHTTCIPGLNAAQSGVGLLHILQTRDTAEFPAEYQWAASVTLANLLAASSPSEVGIAKATVPGGDREMLGNLVSLLELKVNDGDAKAGRIYFSLEQTLRAVRNLALDPNNVPLLAELGAVDHAVRLLQRKRDEVRAEVAGSGVFVDEADPDGELALVAALEALAKMVWTFSFSEELASELRRKGAPALLRELAAQEGAGSEWLLEAVQGALFQLGVSDGSAGAVSPSSASKSKKQNSAGAGASAEFDIMISYQWGTQSKALLVKTALERRGFSVWMDVDKMHGNILEQMAYAVENSSLVLLCMTKEYYLSNACHAEADYTYALNKPRVPLLFETNFRPSGWLGMLLGMQRYVDFTSVDDPHSADPVVDDLVTEIRNQLVVTTKTSSPQLDTRSGLVRQSSAGTSLEAVHTDVKRILSLLQSS